MSLISRSASFARCTFSRPYMVARTMTIASAVTRSHLIGITPHAKVTPDQVGEFPPVTARPMNFGLLGADSAAIPFERDPRLPTWPIPPPSHQTVPDSVQVFRDFRDFHNLKPEPNALYILNDASGIRTFRMDEFARPAIVSGLITAGFAGRRAPRNLEIGKHGEAGDVSFHLGGDYSGWPESWANVTPGNGQLNNGAYADHEEKLRKLRNYLQNNLRCGRRGQVQATFRAFYHEHNRTLRPDYFIVEHEEIYRSPRNYERRYGGAAIFPNAAICSIRRAPATLRGGGSQLPPRSISLFRTDEAAAVVEIARKLPQRKTRDQAHSAPATPRGRGHESAARC